MRFILSNTVSRVTFLSYRGIQPQTIPIYVKRFPLDLSTPFDKSGQIATTPSSIVLRLLLFALKPLIQHRFNFYPPLCLLDKRMELVLFPILLSEKSVPLAFASMISHC